MQFEIQLHVFRSRFKCYLYRPCRKFVAAAQERALLDVARKDADSCNVEPEVFGYDNVPDFSGIEAFVHSTKSQLRRSLNCILGTICISTFPVHCCEHIRIPPRPRMVLSSHGASPDCKTTHPSQIVSPVKAIPSGSMICSRRKIACCSSSRIRITFSSKDLRGCRHHLSASCK
jgi:hypothetical protein